MVAIDRNAQNDRPKELICALWDISPLKHDFLFGN